MSLYQIIKKKNISYLTFDIFEKTQLVSHAFTTRQGGKSMAPFDSLNMGFNVGDDQGLVLDNHQLVAEALEFKTSQVVRGEQVHGLNIEVVDKKKQGGLLDKAKILCKTDGLITSVPNIMLASYYADCVPIMVLDKVAKNIGLFHAGWRGTVKKIALKGILAMKNYLGTNPKDCLAVIAPSIGPCCYQVDSLVKKEFQNNYQNYLSLFTEDGNEKWKLNLWQANRIALEEAGLNPQNIVEVKLCTHCHEDLFFSYRRQNGSCGRMASFIMLK